MSETINVEQLTHNVDVLLRHVLSVERVVLREPQWKDYYNDSSGKVPEHYPEPFESGHIRPYENAVADYTSQLRVQETAAEATRVAKAVLVQQPIIRERICASLTSIADDSKDTAKIVIAALLPVSLAGTIALPLTPILVVGILLIMTRAGIRAFCPQQPPSKKAED
jgi:hypothetical protein